GRAQPVVHDESGADLEQRLPGSLGELIEDRPPRRVGKGPVDVGHRGPIIGKSLLACQEQEFVCNEPSPRKFASYHGGGVADRRVGVCVLAIAVTLLSSGCTGESAVGPGPATASARTSGAGSPTP